MKRLLSLAVGSAMLLGTVCSAGAVEIKPKAQFDFAFGWAENTNYSSKGNGFLSTSDGGPARDNFEARSRARIGADMIISEQLSATVYFEIGDFGWGDKAKGSALGSDGINMETKHAYLDWMIPGTKAKVRMGLQTLGLPHFNGAGNPIFNNDVAGIAINAPLSDTFGISALWARPFDNQQVDTAGSNANDELDVFALVLPITPEGMKISPYIMYAAIGNQGANTVWGQEYEGSATGIAAGLAYQLTMFDPLTFTFSGVYSAVDGGNGANENPDVAGWFIDGSLTYKLDFATAGLFAWYGTGDDADDVADNKYGRAASYSADTGFGYTSFGQYTNLNRSGIPLDNVVTNTSLGTWGLGIELANITFVEDLSHTIRLAYYTGTNDSEVVKRGLDRTIMQSGERMYLTDEDSAWEVNFDHKYNIYENLAAFVELGYISLDMDEDVWGSNKMDNAWRAQLSFQFKF